MAMGPKASFGKAAEDLSWTILAGGAALLVFTFTFAAGLLLLKAMVESVVKQINDPAVEKRFKEAMSAGEEQFVDEVARLLGTGLWDAAAGAAAAAASAVQEAGASAADRSTKEQGNGGSGSSDAGEVSSIGCGSTRLPFLGGIRKVCLKGLCKGWTTNTSFFRTTNSFSSLLQSPGAGSPHNGGNGGRG